MTKDSQTEQKDIHYVVFVHGLWGNPNHLNYVSSTLQKAHPNLHIHVVKRNAGNFTYDGIELGAERVTREIEDELAILKGKGKNVTQISFIGYSMGGLIARFCVGLLYSKGLLGTEPGKMQPMNFNTFATPHIGIRTPLLGWQNDVWNTWGARTLSVSGNQMWTIDNFRDTGRPLLAVMADPESTFIHALKLFKRRSLYANIVNDRAVAFHSAYISDIDPFADISAVRPHYEPGYEDVIVSPTLASPKNEPATWQERSSQVMGKMPFYLAVGVFAPIGIMGFLGNAAVQTFTSASRIKQHEAGQAGHDFGAYRSLPITESIQKKADEMLTRLNSSEGEDYLPATDEAPHHLHESTIDEKEESSTQNANGHAAASTGDALAKANNRSTPFPKLALTKEQFEMKSVLDTVFLDKYGVHIKKVNHSHAAMIIRSQSRPGFSEGKVVSRHWLERWEM